MPKIFGALSHICIGYHKLFWNRILEKCAEIISRTQNGSKSDTIWFQEVNYRSNKLPKS